jgi:hypothetical protein
LYGAVINNMTPPPPPGGDLTFSPPAIGPRGNSTHTFRSMGTGSQKRLVLVTNVPQSGPTVRTYHLVPL